MYYIVLPDAGQRSRLIARLKARGIGAVFHYVPLHSSPAGKKFCRTGSVMQVTEDTSARLVRMPLWLGLEAQLPFVLARAGELLDVMHS
jgi:dTDP-4-amino-4,6-dideoxygalactose transaminase